MPHKFNTFDTVNVPEYGVYNGVVMGAQEFSGEPYYYVQYKYGDKRLTADWFGECIIERV